LGQIAAFPAIGWLADGYGRRWGMFIGCVIVVAGTAVQATASGRESLFHFSFHFFSFFEKSSVAMKLLTS